MSEKRETWEEKKGKMKSGDVVRDNNNAIKEGREIRSLTVMEREYA